MRSDIGFPLKVEFSRFLMACLYDAGKIDCAVVCLLGNNCDWLVC